MINILSALCAVAVYGRILEMGYRNAAAVIIGTAAGTLAHYAFKSITDEKSPPEQQLRADKVIDHINVYEYCTTNTLKSQEENYHD